MSKILRFLTCLFCIVFIGDAAFGAGYTCPTNRQYTTCNEGYYLAHSYTGTSYSDIKYDSTPRAGNACRPCTDYDNHYNRPEGSYYCEGGKKAPVLNVTITYDLNGGSGTAPSATTCKANRSCTLASGATNTFYRAGYVFKGWSISSSGVTNGSTSLLFSDDDIVYAVWVACDAGTYKPSTANANATCSACPKPTPGFEHLPITGNDSLTACRQGIENAEEANEYCDAPLQATEQFDIQCQATSDGTWGDCAIGNVWRAKPGSYVGIWEQTMPAENVIENMCIPCGVGTYSEGGQINSCSACPDLPTGFAYDPGTGLTDITQCYALATNMAAVDADCRNMAWDMGLRVTLGSSSNWDALRTDPVPTGMSALAGTYVNPDMVADTAWKSINGFNADDLCLPCPDGTYNDGQTGSGKVATECTACPGSTRQELAALPVSTGGTGATSYRQCYKYIRLAEVDSNCVSGEVRYRCTANTENSVNYQTHPIPAQDPELAPVAAPGHVVSLPSDMIKPSCSECGAGTYSAGGTVYSCSPCPKLTPGFKYLPTTGNTSLTACIQGIENAADVNKYCAASSEATEEFDIQCQATSDGTWGDCAIGNAWTAKPGSYVGIWKQEMPAEDVIENMCIQCGVGTYSEGGLINSCSECPDLPTGFAYASITGLKKKTQCLAAAANVGLLNENCRDEITSAPVRLVVGAEDDTDWTLYYTVPTTTSMIRANPGAYVNPEILTDGTWQPYSNFNADELCKLCQAGTYNGDMSQTVTSCTACPTGYDDNPETGLTSADMCQISCPGGYYLAAANDATCSEVSPGYWAAEKIVNYGDTSTRTECASGLTTIGYGAGADEADDCGRVLHFGDDTLYLRSVKKTDHALHVGINGTVFYGNMGTDLTKGSLRIKLGDTTYSVYDDRVYDDSM